MAAQYPNPVTVVTNSTIPDVQDKARDLADRLELPLSGSEKDYDFILSCSSRGLELRYTRDPLLTGSFRVDFVGGPAGFRRKHGGSEMLVRAVGHKQNNHTTVLDATGGTGRDAFVLASHGCTVHILERHPVVAALLEDGLQRAQEQADTGEIVERITMTTVDSLRFLKENQNKKFSVVYLDPMFPARSKSSKVKKELQILQLLVGHDTDNDEKLLSAALKTAGDRVVVKRPTAAPPLPGVSPSHCLSSKKIRYDIYMCKKAAGAQFENRVNQKK